MTIKVIELNKSNLSTFNNDIVKPKPQVIMFMAPWCGHCQNLKSELPDVLKGIKKTPGDGMLAMIDEEYIPEVKCDKQIMGYPSIDFMIGGRKKGSYNGPRDAKSLLKYIKKKLGGKNKEIKKNKKTRKNKTRKKKTGKKKRGKKKKRRSRTRKKKSLKQRFLKALLG